MVKKVLTDVYGFWFGQLTGPEDIPREKADLWFSAKPEFDEEIRQTFGKYLAPARDTEWDVANLSRMEQVGLVVLLDQFPRNIYRTSGDAFAFDAKALSVARRLLAGGEGGDFYRAERQFVALPFMHSENLADQEYAVARFANELLTAPPANIESARMGFDFAYKHWAIIRKFGRFPHRNALIGRESTPDEIEFLKGGRGF